jgi:glycerophosphoryl diester phosphodiesterase
MLVAHGVASDLRDPGSPRNDRTFPYDSRSAFVHAVQRGTDGIKGDLRVTKDNVAVVTHSSPITFFESPECAGMLVEQMTADEVTCCHLIGSTTQTFQRVSDLVTWARGRSVVMLDVKNPVDLPRGAGVAADSFTSCGFRAPRTWTRFSR